MGLRGGGDVMQQPFFPPGEEGAGLLAPPVSFLGLGLGGFGGMSLVGSETLPPGVGGGSAGVDKRGGAQIPPVLPSWPSLQQAEQLEVAKKPAEAASKKKTKGAGKS